MYKNFNCELLGISGRQSEIIELALTYGFRGLDVDMVDFFKRCQRTSFDSASRFLISSKLIIGGFRVPVDLDADEDTFTSEVAKLNPLAETAARLGSQYGYLTVPNQTDRLPYPEYFEAISQRVAKVIEVLEKEGLELALTFDPIAAGESKEFRFIRDVDGFVALVKACKRAKIVFDSWAWFCGKGTAEHLEQVGLERVRAVWMADCVEGVAPDSATDDDCVLPGSTEVIDNAGYLKRFVETGLDLPVSPRGRALEKGGTRDAFIAAAQDGLNAVFQAAGIPTSVRKPEMFLHPTAVASEEPAAS